MACSYAFAPAAAVGSRRAALRPARCPLPSPGAASVGGRGGGRVTTTAKIFDWKKRADPDYGKIEGILHPGNIRPAPGSRKRKKRKGRGDAQGQGNSCGFGMRGQKSRSGRSVRPGFEGGQTPLYRRIPKFVGRPMGPGHKRTLYALIQPQHLNACAEGESVHFSLLRERGIMTKQKRKLLKVVGGAPLTTRGLTVRAHAFTTSAQKAIEEAGGTCVLISPTTGKDLVIEEAEEEVEEEVEENREEEVAENREEEVAENREEEVEGNREEEVEENTAE